MDDFNFCEVCNKPYKDWSSHWHSAEHQRNLILARGIPAEVRELEAEEKRGQGK